MAFKYAGNTTVQEIVSKVKALLSGKVDVVAGKGLSTNDLTDALKANYDAAYTHSQAAHAPSDAERNVIVGITVNGVTQSPSAERVVAITTATKVSDLTNDTGFQTADDVSSAITTALASYYTKTEADSAIATAVANASHLKYEVVATLPTSDISTTTIYLVAKDTAEGQNAHTEYLYVNNQWEAIGDTMIDMTQYYTKTEVDSKLSTTLADYVLKTDLVEITAAEVDTMFDGAAS